MSKELNPTPTIETATGVGGNTQTMTMPQHNVKLKRGMRQRHLSMIAIGGSIGTGLFVASGATINQAGPGGALLAYALIGIMVFFLMQSLGEMATYLPIAGSFGEYARRFVSPSFGFAMGWNYWYNWAITVAAELSASALVMKYWLPETPGWIWSGLFLTILFVINALSARAYGEGEFWFALIKVITVVVFLVVGIAMILGILGGQHASFENWTTGDAPFVNGGMGILAVFMIAGFSFQGTEMVGVAAGEAENPEHSVPKAINTVFWRILLFYILAIAVIAFLIPYTDSRLLNPDESIALSPFTLVFEKAGVLAAASVMNAVILTSVLSAGNSGLYASTRMLYSLALQHQAPRFFSYTTRRGVPMNALIATTIIGFFAFLSSLIGDGAAYTWLVNASGLAGFITWVGIAWSHYKFRKAFLAQGHRVEDLPFKASLYPLGPLIALFMCVFVIVGQNYEALLGRGDFLSLLSSYLGLPLFLGLWIGHKLVTRARPVAPHEADFTRPTDFQSAVLAGSVQDVKALKAARKASKQADK
ncbi:amino acid permease [Mobiluncus mulieris]|uniref:Amino acid permease n=2 Tax=Mobiluncus mulieris TaxID=2052 RepID=E0QSH4_9ACTO|nr:amino acid permease [Mobiluncus mulieris]EFM45549.1 amino acid permease [Mobiluncus mulieris ATCC 35239]MBB5845739.1 lysine-specific permease [Mobiluncus mulieris]MCU9971114.1 amino acid permease [Mobiluncus mulieris]MCU9994955.1 amino acid permease [Mobiluncus mulieris]MCU9996396.1 amino acid permease [Mobiluncus mulieris]